MMPPTTSRAEIVQPVVHALSVRVLTTALIGAALAFPCGGQTGAHHPVDMTVVKPETVGFSSERLERLHQLIQARWTARSWLAPSPCSRGMARLSTTALMAMRDMAAARP